MTLKFHEPPYLGLFMVISGGQAGADRGGIEAAYQTGVTTGGFAPKGWRTCRGAAPELATFGLVEDASPDYDVRTRHNIDKSNGTIIIASVPSSPGSRLTRSYAAKTEKPCLVVEVRLDTQDIDLKDHAQVLSDWIIENRICVLNVAGNRDKFGMSIHYHAAYKIILEALLILHSKELLVAEALK